MAHVHNSTLNSRGHEHHKISSDPDFIEQHTDFYEAAGQTCVWDSSASCVSVRDSKL